MGLQCSHDAWSGSYSSFDNFRQAVATTCQLPWPIPWDSPIHPGLKLFLTHSDCEGRFEPEECKLVAEGLESILDNIWTENEYWPGRNRDDTRNFIRGCRKAWEAGEYLEFW